MDRAKCLSNKSLSNGSTSPTSSLRYQGMITKERRPSTHVNFNNLNSIDQVEAAGVLKIVNG